MNLSEKNNANLNFWTLESNISQQDFSSEGLCSIFDTVSVLCGVHCELVAHNLNKEK